LQLYSTVIQCKTDAKLFFTENITRDIKLGFTVLQRLIFSMYLKRSPSAHAYALSGARILSTECVIQYCAKR